MNKIIKMCLIALMAATTTTAFAHHHHHHGGRGFAIGAGILGAGLIASSIIDAARPRPYVAPAPVVVAQPAPVVVQQPQVVVQQPQVVVQQPVGHDETRVQNGWVEGRYVDQVTPQGTVVRTWQPGHYEQRQTQVWVSP